MKNKILILLIIFVTVLTGCDYERPEPIVAEKDDTTIAIDLNENIQTEFIHYVEGAELKTRYYLSDDYNFKQWKITDNKAINIEIIANQLNDEQEILIDQLHADVSIKSVSPQFNGTLKDSIDASYNGTTQDGYLIDTKNKYHNIFAIEGFSEKFISGYVNYLNGYGSGRISESYMTEQGLICKGTYGEHISVVFNLLIKNKGDNKYHSVSIKDDLQIMLPTENIINAVKDMEKRTYQGCKLANDYLLPYIESYSSENIASDNNKNDENE
jgi:hypothetical protein